MQVVEENCRGAAIALSPTDCVKDRLAAFFHGNDLECFGQALLVANAAEVDLAEIERWAMKEGQGGKFSRFLSDIPAENSTDVSYLCTRVYLYRVSLHTLSITHD